ncbi:MAG: 8-oxo-dGTP diphosphatase [Polyangiaceae bacterium]
MSEALLVRDIDWQTWRAQDVGTLVFIVREHEVLLIRKKRGLGAGKINGPGGRLEVGETPLQAAIREVEEEVCVTPLNLQERGELSFEFRDGYRLHAHVFVASGFSGNVAATDEADPFWCSLAALPFHEMWADDALWLPHVLAGRSVLGRFVFDGDSMLDHELTVSPAAP